MTLQHVHQPLHRLYQQQKQRAETRAACRQKQPCTTGLLKDKSFAKKLVTKLKVVTKFHMAEAVLDYDSAIFMLRQASEKRGA